ncbi:MAG: UvrD-helicase domain-containing protein [Syntrophobacteraceae bacterium]|nr:UvrD-helicase domain-containing protein [Syntrophobacteraceae bacterium]
MTLPADSQKRKKALSPGAGFHITAPAGSGKTFLLVARFLRLLSLVDHPRHILALTFTNKAAAEMRERVRHWLMRAKGCSPPESESDAEMLGYASKALTAHSELEELLLAGEILQICTFHSFCYALASQAPFEAEIAPGSTLIDENEQEVFLRETIEEALRQIGLRTEQDPARRAFMSRLLSLNNSWGALADEMKELVKKRETIHDLVQALSRDRASGYLDARVRELAEAELEAVREGFSACELGRGWPDFLEEIGRRGAAAALTLPPLVPQAQWEDLRQWICLADAFLTKDGKVRKQLGPKSGFYSGFAASKWGDALFCLPSETVRRLDLLRRLPAHDTPVTDPDTLWDLVVLLHAVLEIYDARRMAKRALDFSALELAALRLFDAADPSELQLMLDRQVAHILVDEFQDTSREQWELLQKLCAGWSEGDGRTLFLVGDPKQSIYGFRKAEVRLFLAARLGLPLEGGGKIAIEPLVLDTNFRSSPRLIQWCNSVFETTVMADPKPEFDEVEFTAALPPALASSANLSPIELILFLEWPDRASARIREARWLAGRLARQVEENSTSQTAILLFSRTHLPVYLEALREQNVPVQVKDGLKLHERPEVFYLWQLCRAIVLPHDDLAWAAQLRSPWFSLDFEGIYAVSQEKPVLWAEKILAFSERDPTAARLREALAGAWRSVGHEPLANVVESAWLDLDGAHIAVSQWGSRGLNCCRRFLRLIEEAEQGEPLRTLARLEQLLQKAFEPVDPDTALSNIVLSTIHGAKGLEFDSVFIPFMDWDPESGRNDLPPPYMLERSPVSGDYLLAPRPPRLSGEKNPLYDLLRRLRARRQLGEARRLLYVAVTRARANLVMSGLVKRKSKAFSTLAESPMGWLGKHYDIDRICKIDRIDCGDQHVDPGAILSATTGALFPDGFLVDCEPCPPARKPLAAEGALRPEFLPAHFQPEKPLFTVISPSAPLQAPPARPAPPPANPPQTPSTAPLPPSIRGTIVHRLLACFGKNKILPSLASVSAAINRLGAGAPQSLEMAGEAICEVKSCLSDPWLAALYERSPKVEWPVECVHVRNVLYSGVIDLAAEIEGKWILVDFKTSRPAEGEPMEDFLAREMETHSHQMVAYREIVAKLAPPGPAGVDAFLYWTALRQRRQCTGSNGA